MNAMLTTEEKIIRVVLLVALIVLMLDIGVWR